MNWPELIEETLTQSNREGAEAENRNRRKLAQQAHRQAVLLRPKLAYQAKRDRGQQGVEQLKNYLDPCLVKIQNASGERERWLYFTRFVDFFEAILAYHKEAGGN